MKCSERGWAIQYSGNRGKPGLYSGYHRTRASAIAEHVHLKSYAHEEQPSQFDLNGRLDGLQRERWKRCKKNGDRAVRVIVIWQAEK